MNDASPDHPGTIALHGDHASRDGAVVAPIYQATTFAATSNDEFIEAANRDFTDGFLHPLRQSQPLTSG